MLVVSFTCGRCYRTYPVNANLMETRIPSLVCPGCGEVYVWSRIPKGTRAGWHREGSSVEIVAFPHLVKSPESATVNLPR